jgi:hypothetical protein
MRTWLSRIGRYARGTSLFVNRFNCRERDRRQNRNSSEACPHARAAAAGPFARLDDLVRATDETSRKRQARLTTPSAEGRLSRGRAPAKLSMSALLPL